MNLIDLLDLVKARNIRFEVDFINEINAFRFEMFKDGFSYSQNCSEDLVYRCDVFTDHFIKTMAEQLICEERQDFINRERVILLAEKPDGRLEPNKFKFKKYRVGVLHCYDSEHRVVETVVNAIDKLEARKYVNRNHWPIYGPNYKIIYIDEVKES